ncbi:MAG: cupin domain-containing protein [Pseudomonadota bacterium]
MTTSPVINIADVLTNPDFVLDRSRRGTFESRLALIGKALGTAGIGVNLTIVPPKSKAFPRHFHYHNDEMFIILEGTGTLHHGDEDLPLKPMDVINIKAGTGIPFQIDNTSEAELRYLALSTLEATDVFVYPDSNKMGIMAKGAPFRDLSDGGIDRLMKFIPAETSADYYDREPDAAPPET